ncbi:MAG: efflux RND transporter periplasmic adaptor subunit [Steroidobacteraceae bacterium]
MGIVDLKPTLKPTTGPAPMRGTAAQDVALDAPSTRWYRRRPVQIAAGAIALALILFWLARAWLASGSIASLQSLELATVTRGNFVDDVAARGTVIAAVSPTVYSTASGTVGYLVHAGDQVTQDEVLAKISSPELDNEYQRQRSTLESMDAALAQQRVQLRQELLQNRQRTDLAAVTMSQQLRELQRLQAAWKLRLIPEYQYEAAYDTYSIARLNFEDANQNDVLERARILLDLRTRELARNSQALLLADLKQRLDQLTVRSPVNGMVAQLGQADQTHVARSAPLVTVVDLSALAIQFQVAESLSDGIKPGLPTDITLDGQAVKGVVTSVSPDVQDGWVTGRARFVGSQPIGLRQNEQAAVRIVLGRHDDVLKVERGAFLSPETNYLYVLRDDEALRVPVELGAASISEIQVLRGLAAGDQVVISDTSAFNDAPEVKIAR